MAVSIRAPEGATASIRHLEAGQTAVLGTCACGLCEFDITVAGKDRNPATGRITAFRDHWRLENLGDAGVLVVEDLENAHHLVTVREGQGAVPVPFELSRITAGDQALATVFGPEPEAATSDVTQCPSLMPAALALNGSTTYFAVLMALCEPRLRASSPPSLPTDTEIAITLRGKGMRITSNAVSAQIAYLVDKLKLRPEKPSHRHWRKEALATFALRQGLVTSEHLQRWTTT